MHNRISFHTHPDVEINLSRVKFPGGVEKGLGNSLPCRAVVDLKKVKQIEQGMMVIRLAAQQMCRGLGAVKR